MIDCLLIVRGLRTRGEQSGVAAAKGRMWRLTPGSTPGTPRKMDGRGIGGDKIEREDKGGGMKRVNSVDRWCERYLGGHISIGHRVVLFGFNAMHLALNIKTKRWGYICIHPTIEAFGRTWQWYFYASPNATPWAATFAIGPGLSEEEKRLATVRRALFGHGYDPDELRTPLIQINQMGRLRRAT